MDNKISFKDLFHEAGIAGVVLTSVTLAYMLISTLVASIAPNLVILIDLLNILKIVACLWVLRYYMDKFHRNRPESTRSQVRRMGTFTGFLSGLILSAVVMAVIEWNPQEVKQAMDIAYQQIATQNMLTKDVRESLEWAENNISQLTFWANLAKCTLIGWVFSAIFAPRIVPSNPFIDNTPKSE